VFAPSSPHLSDLELERWVGEQAEPPELALSLRGCTQLTGGGLAALSRLPSLRILDLSETGVGSAELECLQNLAQLVGLSLFRVELAPGSLSVLRVLRELRFLELSRTWIEDEELISLESLEKLEQLVLRRTHVTGSGFRFLARLHRLKHLVLHHSPITDVALSHLEPFESLELLALTGTRVRDEGLRHLGKLRRLRQLGLELLPISSRGLDALADQPSVCRSLSDLGLKRTKISDAGLRNLDRFSALKVLSVPDTELTDAAVPYLESLRQLSFLDLKGTRCTDGGLVRLLSKLQDLQALDLRRMGLTGAVLPYITAGLKSLYLGDNPIGDAALEPLARLENLTVLDLANTDITDEGLKVVGGVRGLKLLNLAGTRIGDTGLEHLLGLENLEALDLRETFVTPRGVARLDILPHLDHTAWGPDHPPIAAHRDEVQIR
jgi:hypothetical protein